jgi:hypothetical protein
MFGAEGIIFFQSSLAQRLRIAPATARTRLQVECFQIRFTEAFMGLDDSRLRVAFSPLPGGRPLTFAVAL